MPNSKSENALITEFSKNREELANAIEKERAGVKPTASENTAKGEIEIEEHLMSVADCLKKLDSNPATGLTDAQVQEKFAIFGKNALTPPKTTPLIVILFGHMTGFFSLLLWAAAILCFIAFGLTPDRSNLYLGIVLSIVTFVTGLFSFYQDYQSASVMAGFKSFLPPKTSVQRNGETLSIPSEDLVPGDIVMIVAGNQIPADIRVLEASNFNVNNSSLTGESLAQKRDVDNTYQNALEATNLAFFGTLCEKGSCTGIVIGTADRTVIGTIAKLTTSTDNVMTPIAQEIHHFILIISSVAIFLGVTFMIIGAFMKLDLVGNLVFAIGIIVANVPEGLLATVTVSLTLTAKRMAKKKVLVKNLEAVETLGSTTVIASDKTGTLTQNIMTVKHVYYDGATHDATEATKNAEYPLYDTENASFKRLKLVAALCNNAKFDANQFNAAKDDTQKEIAKDSQLKYDEVFLEKVQNLGCIGDASESALIKFCEKICVETKTGTMLDERERNNKIAEVPFNSTNKFQISIHTQDNNQEKPRLLVMKGAPERIWNRCDYILMNGNDKEPIAPHKPKYDADIVKLMEAGERVLGMCYIELDPKEYPPDYVFNTDDDFNFPTDKGSGLVFAGLMALQDPPRKATGPAVLSCQSAGIKVIMVTGDHPDTAEAIAKDVHIITGLTRKTLAKKRGVDIETVDRHDMEIDAVVITGDMLKTLSPEELDYYLDFSEVVFARTSPAQKLQIVQGLQNKTHIHRGQPADEPKMVEHVVAVTGDGVNDSPALKAANIGVAMGIVGSDVAKDAADMILLNDNFASIVKGVEEGRLIFDNLKKSIAYTLSSNIPEISPFLIFMLIQIPEPLTTVLILCIDLGTDMVPAISLAYEFKEADIMFKPPRDKRVDRLVASKLINFSYFQIGVVQAAAGFYTYVVVLMNFGFPPEFLPFRARWFFKGANTTTLAASAAPAAVLANLKIASDYAHPIMRYCGNKVLGIDTDIDCVYYPLTKCNFPDSPLCHSAQPPKTGNNSALQHAQCAFFIAIIVVQWADLVICKTRTLSMFQQGMRNGTLNFGLAFTSILGCMLCYIPGLPIALGTAPLHFVHWCPAMPFCIMIFLYDEVRKLLIRQNPKGWVFRNTYY